MNKDYYFYLVLFVYSLTFGQSTNRKNKKNYVTTVNKTLTKKQNKAVRKNMLKT